MKKINSPEKLEYYLQKERIREYFDTPFLPFTLVTYEKGEFLTTPETRLDRIIFIVEGTIQIYGIRGDGSMTPVNQLASPALIGDIEFTEGGNSPLFTEARSTVSAVCLDTEEYRSSLNKDISFLHLLLSSYAEKIRLFTTLDTVTTRLEERVLLYLESIAKTNSISGMEEAVLKLRCSRRQLQRVLKKLCDEGKVEKTGRGSYRLCTTADTCR